MGTYIDSWVGQDILKLNQRSAFSWKPIVFWRHCFESILAITFNIMKLQVSFGIDNLKGYPSPDMDLSILCLKNSAELKKRSLMLESLLSGWILKAGISWRDLQFPKCCDHTKKSRLALYPGSRDPCWIAGQTLDLHSCPGVVLLFFLSLNALSFGLLLALVSIGKQRESTKRTKYSVALTQVA